MSIRMLAIRAWIPLAGLLIWLPGPRQQAADPALAQLKQGDEFFNQAIKDFDEKKYTEGNEARARGIESYQKAIQLNPRLFEAHRRLGDLLRKNTSSASDFQRAVDAYKKALEIKPDAETSSRLGITYTALGKLADAIPAFEQAARLDPTVAMYQYNLGFTYTELLNLDAARKTQSRLQTMDQALAQQLLDKIRKTSGEASLIGRPKTYANPKIVLVAIPPGSFEMGGWSNGTTGVPGRKVTIKQGFYMGKYPVTQAQWQAVMGDNPSFFKNCGGNCPVEQVSWHDAQGFVTRLNQLKDGFRYRLPSEAEWEYAYRGGTKTIDYAEGDIGWHSRNSGSKTHPVGEKPANPFGLYDMGGHVQEWCLDWYASPGTAIDASPVAKGDEPMYRVLRGMSFYAMPSSGVTTRNKGRVDEVSRNNGFRVVAEKEKLKRVAMSQSGRVAVVTGSSKGIGYAIAEALVQAGASVTVSARNAEEVGAAAARLNALGKGRALGVPCDVRDPAAVRELIHHSVAEFGGLDILVNNAGVGHFAPVAEISFERWDQVIETNLSGVFYCCREAIPQLRKRGGGWIINIASLAGKNPLAGGTAYNASKFGLVGFSEALLLDVRNDNIRVSYLMPGSVATHFNDHTPSEADAWKIQPEDIAQVVLDLLEVPARTMPSRVELRPSRPPRHA